MAKGDLTQHAEPFPFQSVFIPRAVPVGGTRARPSEERPRLLRGQDAEPPLQGQAVPRVLVVGGEAGRVRRAGGLPRRGHLLEGVDALPALIRVALQEHGGAEHHGNGGAARHHGKGRGNEEGAGKGRSYGGAWSKATLRGGGVAALTPLGNVVRGKEGTQASGPQSRSVLAAPGGSRPPGSPGSGPAP